MPRQRTARKARPGRNHPAGTAYGVPVPEGLHEAIENERSNLSRAESVLGCLAISMENQPDSADGPYYPDVAQLARELVRRSINGLDSLTLQKKLLKNRVKEGAGQLGVEGSYLVLDPAECIHEGCFSAMCRAA